MIKNTPQKKFKKADCKGGEVNACGQPDRKISAFFDDFPKLYGVLGTVSLFYFSPFLKERHNSTGGMIPARGLEEVLVVNNFDWNAKGLICRKVTT